jgi:hypothetical protein
VFRVNNRGSTLKILCFLPILLLAAVVSTIALLAYSQEVSALDENNCLSCHSKSEAVKTNSEGNKISLRIAEADINGSAHKFVDCTSCHSTKPHDPTLDLSKLTSAEKCGSCHQYEYKEHLSSIHGQQLAQGNSDVATCVDCHSIKGEPHSVLHILDYNASTYTKNIAGTCAKCHNNEELMGKYGIVEKVYESYLRSYHGKALEMSSLEISQIANTATCTNCHGSHNIKAVNDPTSPVLGMINLAQTCGLCHANASVEFAQGFLGHKEPSSSHIPVAFYVEGFFEYLFYVVMGFAVLVVIIAVSAYARKRWRN